MNQLFSKYALCLSVVCFLMLVVSPQAFAAPEAAVAPAVADSAVVKFVQELGNKALTSLTAKELPQDERSQRVRSLLLQYFDIQAIGRFVLGASWSQATEAERQEYLKLFEDMIVRTYTRRFAEYSGQSFEVKDVVPAGEDGKDSIVSSIINQPKDGPPVRVDWRVRDENGAMKIVDVLVENVSMSITQRADFASIIQNGGMPALLKTLRNRPQL